MKRLRLYILGLSRRSKRIHRRKLLFLLSDNISVMRVRMNPGAIAFN